jgi:transposase
VVRAHQHAAGAPHAPPPHLAVVDAVSTEADTQGVGSNDNESGTSTDREALGRSCGSLTTKVHFAADQRCRRISRVITPGQRHDAVAFEPVMAGIRRRGRGRPRTRPDRVLGDKAYSSRPIRTYLRQRGIKTTIPERTDQQAHHARLGNKGGRPPKFDPETYTQRNVVERCINKHKQFRAVATRDDTRAYIFAGTVDVVSIRIRLRDPVP